MLMATYLYCVRSDPVAPGDWLTGIDGGRVRGLDVSNLLAWVSDVPIASIDATIERIKAHDAVCAAALENGDTPLPIRFGQAFPDDDAMTAGIAQRATELHTRLARLRGCVELRVVVTRGRASDDRPVEGRGEPALDDRDTANELEGPGTAFLKRIARAGRAELSREVGCEEARQALRSAAEALIVDHHRCESARGLAYFPILVRRDDVTAFRETVANTLTSQAIDLAVLGPFAPYSFAGDV
jgi:hypothetical protein